MSDLVGKGVGERLSTSQLARALGVDCSASGMVSIDFGALGRIAEHIQQHAHFADFQRFSWDDPKFWNPEATRAERSQYLAVGNAINFRFWTLGEGVVVPAGGRLGGEPFTGAMYMWRCLRRCWDEGRYRLFEASSLSRLTEDEFDAIFADDHGVNPLAVAKADRLANLQNLGARLEERWGGQFVHIVDASGGSLVEFAGLSAEIRAFDDPLFKLTMVNTILHLGSGLVKFNAEPLPGIDYHLLQQVLRQGILLPRRSLVTKLERQELLDPHEAHELRRVALCAFVELSARTGISGEILDNKWWWNRLQCRTAEPVCLRPETAERCPFLDACARRSELGMPLEETRYY